MTTLQNLKVVIKDIFTYKFKAWFIVFTIFTLSFDTGIIGGCIMLMMVLLMFMMGYKLGTEKSK